MLIICVGRSSLKFLLVLFFFLFLVIYVNWDGFYVFVFERICDNIGKVGNVFLVYNINIDVIKYFEREDFERRIGVVGREEVFFYLEKFFKRIESVF